ncbi:MAG: hypothetical protein R2882_05690 [Gemmatimonadales bacterium]
MAGYWTKIGLGSVAIFGIGMTGVSLAREGISELKTVAYRPVKEALAQAPKLLTFRMDGQRLGRLRAIDVNAERGTLEAGSIRMLVDIEPGRIPSDLATCALTPERGSRTSDASFRCVDEATVSDEGLVEVGQIEFQPADITRPLYLARRDLRQIRRSDINGLKARISSETDNAIQGVADFDVTTNRGRRERGTVTIDAKDGKAVIEVRGKDGRELFKLNATDAGVSISAHDKDGANLLRLLAGEAGVHLDVKAEKNN